MPKLKNARHFADIFVSNVLLRHPDAVENAEDLRKVRDDFGAKWPDWCYLPMAAVYAIITKGVTAEKAAAILEYSGGTSELSELTATLIWRIFKGVYRFDLTMGEELAKQEATGAIPLDALYRLPEPCIFIEEIGSAFGIPYIGYFVWLENDVGEKGVNGPELRFLFLKEDLSSLPYPLILSGRTLEDSVENLVSSASERSGGGGRIFEVDGVRQIIIDSLLPLLNRVLYLCSDAPDVIGDYPWHNRGCYHVSSKIPKRPNVWRVGTRIGAALRTARLDSTNTGGDRGISRTSPRAHIRRAHWHHYWTGAKDSERALVLKWLPPIPVNMEFGDDIPTTIRIVKE